jgi:hypothetical protein
MTPAEVRAVIFELPGVEERVSLGSVRFSVAGKVLTRLGVRTGPEDLLFHDVGFDEAEVLAASAPQTFVSIPHFRDSNCIAAHIATLEPAMLRALLERRWRKIAPKRMARQRDRGSP